MLRPVLKGLLCFVGLIFGLIGVSAYAQPRADLPPTQRPSEELSAVDLANAARSTVRIIERENHQIEEHRVGNNVYMVKVKPKNAPPYYLIDEDGSGDLQWRRGTNLERTAVPHWAIVRW